MSLIRGLIRPRLLARGDAAVVRHVARVVLDVDDERVDLGLVGDLDEVGQHRGVGGGAGGQIQTLEGPVGLVPTGEYLLQAESGRGGGGGFVSGRRLRGALGAAAARDGHHAAQDEDRGRGQEELLQAAPTSARALDAVLHFAINLPLRPYVYNRCLT